MKYLTKEYYALEWLSYTNHRVKKSKTAERYDEKFYERMYQKIYTIFETLEKTCDWYQDPKEELQRIDDYINEPNISDEERNRRIAFKKVHVYMNRERIESGTVFEFDKEVCKRKFEERNRALVALYSRLPQEILDKIADIRIFALGCASMEVKQLLRPYCAELRRTVRQIREKAYAETDEAEKYLSDLLGLNEYENESCPIMGIEEKDGNLYLKGEDNDCLLIKEGKIIEGKEKTIYPYHKDIPNGSWSRIIAAELHRVDHRFEIHFLVSNGNEIEKEDLWYLTISGAEILKNK